MANLKTDLPTIGLDKSKREIQAFSPTGHHEIVDGSSASATSTETFYPGQVVRLAINTDGNFIFADATVTAADRYLAAWKPEQFTIHEETKISVLGGKLSITVMK